MSAAKGQPNKSEIERLINKRMASFMASVRGGGVLGSYTQQHGTGAGGTVAATLSVDTAPGIVVGPSGTVTVTATIGADIGGGATSVAGEQVAIQARINGLPVGGTFPGEFSATHAVVNGTVVFNQSGLTPGSTVTGGIQLTNQTTPAHTSRMLASVAVISTF